MTWFFISLLSALLSSGAAVIEKKVLFKSSPLALSFIVSFLGFFISIFLILPEGLQQISGAGYYTIVIKSILSAYAFYYVMKGLKDLEISSSLPFLVLTPAFVAIFGYIVLGEKLKINEITGIVLLLTGTYYLEYNHKENLFHPLKIIKNSKSHRFIFIALFLFTITSILDKVIVTKLKVSVSTFIFLQQFVFVVVFYILLILNRKTQLPEFRNLDYSTFNWLFIIAVLSIGYRYSQTFAIKLAPVAVVLSLKRISVFFSVVIGGKLFKEKRLLMKSLATLLMITGAILIFRD